MIRFTGLHTDPPASPTGRHRPPPAVARHQRLNHSRPGTSSMLFAISTATNIPTTAAGTPATKNLRGRHLPALEIALNGGTFSVTKVKRGDSLEFELSLASGAQGSGTLAGSCGVTRFLPGGVSTETCADDGRPRSRPPPGRNAGLADGRMGRRQRRGRPAGVRLNGDSGRAPVQQHARAPAHWRPRPQVSPFVPQFYDVSPRRLVGAELRAPQGEFGHREENRRPGRGERDEPRDGLIISRPRSTPRPPW